MNNQTHIRENYKILACTSETGDLYILPLTQDAAIDKPIQLLPFGKVKSEKGDFNVDAVAIQAIMERFKSRKNDVVIDYEHQTLKDVIAPAAGWIKELIDKGADGLWGVVEWTPKAQEYLKNKEYRYFSPVIAVRKSDKRPILLHSGALTNTPAIDGMEPIACKIGGDPAKEEKTVNEWLKKIAALLGLPETATEEEIIAAITKLVQSGQIVANKELLTLLGLPEGAKLDETKGAIIALKNPSGYVKVEEFKSLQDKLALRDRDELVDLALKAGKIAPASLDWAKEYALKDPAGFKSFVDKAPVVVPLQEIAGGAAARETVTDEMQLSINKSLGISSEDYKKFGGE